VNIEFDPHKDRANREKHGISLADADMLDWSQALIWHDARRDYGEPRQVALAPLGQRLYCVVFVERGTTRRIISFRKANQREFKYYESQVDTPD
jgi:uncharacterized DUF497 family protein